MELKTEKVFILDDDYNVIETEAVFVPNLITNFGYSPADSYLVKKGENVVVRSHNDVFTSRLAAESRSQNTKKEMSEFYEKCVSEYTEKLKTITQ